MATESNIAGVARLLYLVVGSGVASWGLWGADQGWTQWAWLAFAGAILVCGIIGYSPVNAFLPHRNQKAG